MQRELHRFTAKAVEHLGPGMHHDGGGLMLRVLANATEHTGKSWVLRYWLHGQERRMGLGTYPRVTLKDARAKAANARRLLDSGVDPIEARKRAAQEARQARAKGITFEEAAKALIRAKAAEWRSEKHQAQWSATLEAYAYPIIGKFPVASIETAHIIKVLEPIWKDKNETASRLRGRLENVLSWASARGFRAGENPARWRGNLSHLLPAPSKVQKEVQRATGKRGFAAMPYADLPAFMQRLAQRDGAAAQALSFTIHTAARSGEVRGMTWDEVDLDKGVWTVPAHRMKAEQEHAKPLSEAALRILQSRKQQHGGEGLVFASDMKPRSPMSDMTLAAVLKRMKVNGATVHGFRAAFRTWAAEETLHPSWVAEMALAHTVKGIEAHYQRGDLMDKRRALAAEWSAYLEGGAANG